MRFPPRSIVSVVCVAIAVLGIPSILATTKVESIKSYSRYVEISGAKAVGADTCVTCHEAVTKNFGHAFHAQQGVECEQCHGNGSLHVDGGGDTSKIVAFSKRTADQANGVCLSCHAQGEKLRNWVAGSHSANHIRCMDCHQIHQTALKAAKTSNISFDQATRGALVAASVSPETNVIVRPMWETNDACLKCHPTERAQLSMPYHHPLREGKMSCVDCHDPHGGADGRNLKNSNLNQLCLGCHAQYRGPFAYQHPPVTENCMLCHVAHGSPNTNLLSVSEPALCLQCHAGHHNGAGLPLPDRCTNCHGTIHGTDVPTPSGGSRFADKGPSEQQLNAGFAPPPVAATSTAHSTAIARAQASAAMTMAAHSNIAPANATALMVSHAPALSASAMGGMLGMMSSGAAMAPLAGGMSQGGSGMGGGTEINDAGTTAYSLTAGQYRFVDGSGYLGRVGEYDTLDQSAGTDMSQSYVSKEHNLTIVSRASVVTGADYSAAAQLTWADRLQAGLFFRSFMQQQDNYPFYAFPVLDVPPGSTIPPDSSTNLIPNGSVFGVTRRMGNAYARFRVPRLPVHLFVRGDWQAHAGTTQLSYLDENTGNSADTCGAECHHTSAFQDENYTTRNIAGGVQVDLKQFQATWEHTFSSFNDRLNFPTGNFGGFFPEVEGISAVNPPPYGPAPPDVPAGNYALNIPPPSQFNADRLSLNWTASPNLLFNGNVGYTRVSDTYTRYSQKWFNTDETLSWRPINRLRVIADYHQQNVINDFVPYYSLYGNVSYHNHDVGVRADYELLKALDAEVYYKRSGITRSNATLWPQIYSINNTDLLTVVPSSTSNTTGLAVRYHDQSYWSMRAGYEWTGTNNPGYLIVPQSNNRMFADVWITPAKWLVFSNDFSIIWQNGSPAIPLLRADGTGAAGDFQRNNRYYFETASATLRLVPDWDLSLGYSYQQNNLSTYMAFQNDPAVGYVLNQPVVPYRQIAQAYWGESSYTLARRLGLNMRITYNSSRSSLRPDLNPANAATMGNATLIQQGVFDPVMFSSALNNLNFASTQISGVIVPQWIGQGKVYYLFPRKFEGGFVFHYGSYRDYWNPNVNGVLRTATIYVGKSW